MADVVNTEIKFGDARGMAAIVTFEDLAGAIRATGGLVIPPEFGYTGSSPMLVRSHMVSELEKTDAAQRSCELFRGSLISHLIGPKKAAALIDVAAAIGLRWQQEVVQAEVPSPRHEQRRTQHPGLVVRWRTPHAVGMATWAPQRMQISTFTFLKSLTSSNTRNGGWGLSLELGQSSIEGGFPLPCLITGGCIDLITEGRI